MSLLQTTKSSALSAFYHKLNSNMKFFLCAICCGLLLIGNASTSNASKLAELPIYTYPKAGNKPLIVYLSGDGGLNAFSKELISNLNNQGYALVVLDTRKYFWDKKTPEQFAKDLGQTVSFYLRSWNKSSFALLGYSFGADVGAFVPALLSEGNQDKLKSMVLLSPGFSTGFVTKLSNMLGMGNSDNEHYKVYPQLLKCPAPVVCVFGKTENSDFYKALKPTANIKKMLIPGSHKYDDNVKLVAQTIITHIN
jgi:type IV secretory pathway VirJ component